MSWLDKLLGPNLYNPDLRCMRVRTCGACRGKGYVLQRKPEP